MIRFKGLERNFGSLSLDEVFKWEEDLMQDAAKYEIPERIETFGQEVEGQFDDAEEEEE